MGDNRISVERSFPNEAGQPIPRALVKISGMSAQQLVQALYNQDPKIATIPGVDGVFVNPMTMEEGEMDLVGEGLKRILQKTEV